MFCKLPFPGTTDPQGVNQRQKIVERRIIFRRKWNVAVEWLAGRLSQEKYEGAYEQLAGTLALTMDGTKRWPDRKRLERFGVRHCRLTPAAARAIVAEVAGAVDAAAKDLVAFSELDPGASETASLRRSAWVDGVASLALAGSGPTGFPACSNLTRNGAFGLSCRQVEFFAASQADDVMFGKRYGKILTPRYIPPFRVGKDPMRCCFTSSTLQQATTAIRAPDAEHLHGKNHATCDKKPNNAQHQFDVVVAADKGNCGFGIEWKDGKNAKHGEHRKANRRSQHTTSYLQPRTWLKCLVHLWSAR